jgi:hypothetical protein
VLTAFEKPCTPLVVQRRRNFRFIIVSPAHFTLPDIQVAGPRATAGLASKGLRPGYDASPVQDRWRECDECFRKRVEQEEEAKGGRSSSDQ